MQILDYESDARRWRAWFAWYPLLINGQSVWLRTVQRRPEYLRNRWSNAAVLGVSDSTGWPWKARHGAVTHAHSLRDRRTLIAFVLSAPLLLICLPAVLDALRGAFQRRRADRSQARRTKSQWTNIG